MTVAICDHHAIIRDGIRQALDTCMDGGEVVDVPSYSEALELTRRQTVSLVILEPGMPGWHPLDGLDAIRGNRPDRIAIVSGIEDPAIIKASLDRGVSGYIPKRLGLRAITSALRLILTGEIFVPSLLLEGTGSPEAKFAPTLTPRERQVLSLLREGHSNKVIARQLNLSEVTVKTHLSSTFRKMGVHNRVQAVRQLA